MWTFAHFITLVPALIIYIAIAWGIGKLFKNKDEKIRLIPIHIITGLITVLEIIKQVRSLVMGYDLGDLPFYYCSLFLYLYPVVSLYRGKNKNSFRTLAFVSGMTLLGVMLVMPEMVYSKGNIDNFFVDFGDFHTVIFHNLVLLGTFLLLSLGFVKVDLKRDLLVVFIFYTTYCVIAAPMANLLGQNYNHFSRNGLAAIENLRLSWINSLGQLFGQSLYVLCDFIITVGFSIVVYLLFVFVRNLVIDFKEKHGLNKNEK